MKRTPYNTGKVLIGSRYEPPRQMEMSRDAERLQNALLRRDCSPTFADFAIGTLISVAITLVIGTAFLFVIIK